MKPTLITEDQNILAAYDGMTSGISLKSEDERFLFDWLEGKMVGTLVSYTSPNTSRKDKFNLFSTKGFQELLMGDRSLEGGSSVLTNGNG